MILLENEVKRFIDKVSSTQTEMTVKYDQLMSLLKSHQSDFMEKLSSFKDKIIKKVEVEKEEMERQYLITESFNRYCQEMINKESAYDISRAGHDLHVRAEEIVKAQNKPDCLKLTEIQIMFKPSNVTTDTMKICLGKLVLNGQ